MSQAAAEGHKPWLSKRAWNAPQCPQSLLDPIRGWNLSAELICFNSHPEITFYNSRAVRREKCIGTYSLLSAELSGNCSRWVCLNRLYSQCRTNKNVICFLYQDRRSTSDQRALSKWIFLAINMRIFLWNEQIKVNLFNTAAHVTIWIREALIWGEMKLWPSQHSAKLYEVTLLEFIIQCGNLHTDDAKNDWVKHFCNIIKANDALKCLNSP